MPRLEGRRGLAALLAAIFVAGAGAGWLARSLAGHDAGGVASAENVDVHGSTRQPAGEIRWLAQLPTGDHANALLWDGEKTVWAAVEHSDDSVDLVRYDVDSGSSQTWTLPVKGTQTPETFIVRGGGGLIWVASNYAIAAFDPAKEAWAYETTLAVAAPDLPAAVVAQQEQHAPLSGTWITGLMAAGDGAIVLTRHNVPDTFTMTLAGVALQKHLKAAPEGLVRIANTPAPYLLGDNAVFAPVADETEASASLPANAVALTEAATCSGWELRDAGEIAVATDGRVKAVIKVQTHPFDFAADSGGDALLFGMTGTGTVIRIACGDGSAESYQLGSADVPADGMPRDPNADPDSGIMEHLVTRPEALALSAGGHIAVSTSLGQVGWIP